MTGEGDVKWEERVLDREQHVQGPVASGRERLADGPVRGAGGSWEGGCRGPRGPRGGCGLDPRSGRRLQRALAGTSQGTPVWSPAGYLQRLSQASGRRDSKNSFSTLSGFKFCCWASLVAQWLRIHLPVQETRV